MIVLRKNFTFNDYDSILVTDMAKKLEKISNYLSLVLRHKPEQIGIVLDKNGWTNIHQLILQSNTNGFELDEATIFEVVATSDKQRFAISEDGTNIRANQGHSIAVDLEHASLIPPDFLLHGTAARFLDSILINGLSKMSRQHVHLTENSDSAMAVGTRYGKPVLLRIDSNSMSKKGYTFYKSENGVWLVSAVPPEYISVA